MLSDPRDRITQVSPPTVMDLFAGCGGMTVGFRDAGFEPVQAVEWDLPAAATYAANFGDDHMFWGDIIDFRDDIPEVDVVVGGPPCQGFSSLGHQDARDPRNKLWRQYVRVVVAARPKMFVIENVQRFKSSPEFQLLRAEVIAGDLKDYKIAAGVLMAADYGVPQKRPRMIVVGSRIGTPRLPEPTHASRPTLTEAPWLDVRSAIEDVPWQTETTELPATTEQFFGEAVPGVFKGLDLHIGRRPLEKSLQRYDCIPPGGGRLDLPDELQFDCWKNKPKGTTDVMGRMRWDRPSLTIRTEFFKPEKGQYLHPQWDAEDPDNRVNRPITHLEAARLQTFPEDYLWCGTKIGIARQIGNAVPCRLAHRIALSVRDQLED